MLPNIGNLQKQVQKMQQDMLNLQEKLDAERLETSSGGGMVTVTTSGMGEVLEIKIAPEVVDPNDVEMLQDMMMAAFNEAAKKVDEEAQGKMGGMLGGMGLPPGMF